LAGELSYPAPALTWRPAPAFEPYVPPLTGAQQALREGVITLPHPGRRWWVSVREVAETVLLALLIFLSVRASFQNFRVEGASMDPSLHDGEYLIVNKLSYAELDLGMFDFLPFFDAGDDPVKHLWGGPERGDVIVFKAPTSPNRDFIKRIVGLPGDTVEITPNAEVIVNGVMLTEPYAAGQTNCNAQECTWVIPERGSPDSRAKCASNSCYFVMGDNRQNSSDSRQGWLVPEENIIGKALITYWHEGGPELDLAPNRSVGLTDEAAAEN
jgi:signal peptidase I